MRDLWFGQQPAVYIDGRLEFDDQSVVRVNDRLLIKEDFFGETVNSFYVIVTHIDPDNIFVDGVLHKQLEKYVFSIANMTKQYLGFFFTYENQGQLESL